MSQFDTYFVYFGFAFGFAVTFIGGPRGKQHLVTIWDKVYAFLLVFAFWPVFLGAGIARKLR